MSILVMHTRTGTFRAKAIPRCSLLKTPYQKSALSMQEIGQYTCSCRQGHYLRRPLVGSSLGYYLEDQILLFADTAHDQPNR